jgi:hypothetical protein
MFRFVWHKQILVFQSDDFDNGDCHAGNVEDNDDDDDDDDDYYDDDDDDCGYLQNDIETRHDLVINANQGRLLV